MLRSVAINSSRQPSRTCRFRRPISTGYAPGEGRRTGLSRRAAWSAARKNAAPFAALSPPRRSGWVRRPRTEEQRAGIAGATLSHVTRVSPKTRLQAVRTGVGEEYAISGAANPAADQSAHRRPAHPNRRRRVSAAPEGVFCHAAKRERRAEWSSAACTRTDRVPKLAGSSSQIATRVLLLRNTWWLVLGGLRRSFSGSPSE
jgi:hypothetical protein